MQAQQELQQAAVLRLLEEDDLAACGLGQKAWGPGRARGRLHESEFSGQVCEVAQYGPNVRALAVHLTQGQLLPFARVGELIKDLYGLYISLATLVPTVQAAAAVHVDESGLRVSSRLQWLHTAVTATPTWYEVHLKRGIQAITDHGMLPSYVSMLVHDCWAPY